jgi:hypothetical protein
MYNKVNTKLLCQIKLHYAPVRVKQRFYRVGWRAVYPPQQTPILKKQQRRHHSHAVRRRRLRIAIYVDVQTHDAGEGTKGRETSQGCTLRRRECCLHMKMTRVLCDSVLRSTSMCMHTKAVECIECRDNTQPTADSFATSQSAPAAASDLARTTPQKS